MSLIRQKQKCTETSQVASIFPLTHMISVQSPDNWTSTILSSCHLGRVSTTPYTLDQVNSSGSATPAIAFSPKKSLTNKPIFSQSQALEVQKATVQIYLQTKVQMRSWACKGFCFGNCIEPKPIYSLYLNICVFIMKLCLFIKNINYVLFLKNKKHIYNLV